MYVTWCLYFNRALTHCIVGINLISSLVPQSVYLVIWWLLIGKEKNSKYCHRISLDNEFMLLLDSDMVCKIFQRIHYKINDASSVITSWSYVPPPSPMNLTIPHRFPLTVFCLMLLYVQLRRITKLRSLIMFYVYFNFFSVEGPWISIM